MTAETVHSIIKALPKEELPALYRLMGVTAVTKKEIEPIDEKNDDYWYDYYYKLIAPMFTK